MWKCSSATPSACLIFAAASTCCRWAAPPWPAPPTRWTASAWPALWAWKASARTHWTARSEEHTSELQSPCNLVCRLLLEKKKKINLLSKTSFTYQQYLYDYLRLYQTDQEQIHRRHHIVPFHERDHEMSLAADSSFDHQLD